jgi:hypothetical protein
MDSCKTVNLGDTYLISLNYMVNGIPLVDFEPDEIEFYFGSNRYLLSDGTIQLNQETNVYQVFVDQEQSFSLNKKWTEYQIRVRKGRYVSSPCVNGTPIGNAISREVI